MACVRELHRAGKRLPFGFEVVGFAEEEGQRYKATFLGSGALTGHFDPTWLDQHDADGVSMRDAMQHAGLGIADIPELQARPGRLPGLRRGAHRAGPGAQRDRPAAGRRHLDQRQRALPRRGRRHGQPRRHDADGPPARRRHRRRRAGAVSSRSAAPRCRTWSARWACCRCPTARSTWCPGAASSASTSARPRTRCATPAPTTCCAELKRICERRGLHFRLEETMRAAAAPSAPAWQQRWERAVEALGLPVYRMPSGAGHDAMKLHEVMPQAMLFMRGAERRHQPQPAGIDHQRRHANCASAPFQHLLNQLADGDRHEPRLRSTRRLGRRPFRRAGALPAAPGAGAHRHAAGQQRAACRARRRAAEGLRLRRREAPGAGARGARTTACSRSPT